jgi:hypothetical protein
VSEDSSRIFAKRLSRDYGWGTVGEISPFHSSSRFSILGGEQSEDKVQHLLKIPYFQPLSWRRIYQPLTGRWARSHMRNDSAKAILGKIGSFKHLIASCSPQSAGKNRTV